jgi:hypothetical protein
MVTHPRLARDPSEVTIDLAKPIHLSMHPGGIRVSKTLRKSYLRSRLGKARAKRERASAEPY